MTGIWNVKNQCQLKLETDQFIIACVMDSKNGLGGLITISYSKVKDRVIVVQ